MDIKKQEILEKPIATWAIAFLILYSVICFSIETLPNLSDSAVTFLGYSEAVVVAIFTAEYLYRVYVAENRLRFIFSFYGLIDLAAILPFYLSLAFDFRALRLLRFLRLVRLLKLARYNRALSRFAKAILITKEELIIFLSAIFVLLYLSAFGIYQFEHEAQPDKYASIFDALWWAVATITTVGYGDIYPITVVGRVFTFAILILGLGLIAVPTGIIASALAAVRSQENSTISSSSEAPDSKGQADQKR